MKPVTVKPGTVTPGPVTSGTVKPGTVLARLQREPQRFAFDAAVRVLAHAARAPDLEGAARFRSPPGLAFPPADILAVQPGRGAPLVTTPVMALTGATGVLPRYYSEVLAVTLRNRSRAMHDFLDMLAHRFVLHFARAGSKYRLHRATELARLGVPERGREAHTGDPMAGALLALTGYGTPHLVGRNAAGSDALLHYAGLLAMRPRSADRLAALASDWLGRRVEVQQFAGAWLSLPPDQRTRMPVGRMAGAFNRLGVDAAIGVRAWDVQARVVLRIGPLDRDGFNALLPDRPALRRLVALVRAYLGFETGFAVNPVLAQDAVPVLVLGGGGTPARLGWNTWFPAPGLGRRGPAAEAVFEAEVVEAEPEGALA